jgi:thiol-disulfide isomerase/thioredoxin
VTLKALLPAAFVAALTTLCLCGAASAQKHAPPRAAGAKPSPRAAKPSQTAAKPSQTAAKPAPAARPKVTQIGEPELQALLAAGASRQRPLLVNFWATWCAPCRDEFPDLVQIRAQYAAEKLDFVLVSLDDPSDIATAVPDFLAEARATAFPSYLLRAGDDNAAINLVDPGWSGELPATFLYDRSGALVFKHKGRVKPAELRAALDSALADKPLEAGARE